MAPAKAPKAVKLKVPRHNAQRINAKLTTEVRHQAKVHGVLVDTNQPSSKLNQAIESASEWNSLLMTARAERGPQWDIGTQQFLVDKYSDLYYDPTDLLEAVKKVTDEENGTDSASQPSQSHQSQHHQHQHQQNFHLQQPPVSSRHHTPQRDRDRDYAMSNVHPHMGREASPHRHPSAQPGNYPYSGSPGGMPMRGPPGGGGGPYSDGGPSGGGGNPYNPGGGTYGDMGSPMRGNMGGMGMGMGMGGMRPGMGSGGGMGGIGGMPGSGMGGMPGGMSSMSGGGMSTMAGGMGNMGNMNTIGLDHGGTMGGMPMNMSPRNMRPMPDEGFMR